MQNEWVESMSSVFEVLARLGLIGAVLVRTFEGKRVESLFGEMQVFPWSNVYYKLHIVVIFSTVRNINRTSDVMIDGY